VIVVLANERAHFVFCISREKIIVEVIKFVENRVTINLETFFRRFEISELKLFKKSLVDSTLSIFPLVIILEKFHEKLREDSPSKL
jgi:hypothetical protein